MWSMERKQRETQDEREHDEAKLYQRFDAYHSDAQAKTRVQGLRISEGRCAICPYIERLLDKTGCN